MMAVCTSLNGVIKTAARTDFAAVTIRRRQCLTDGSESVLNGFILVQKWVLIVAPLGRRSPCYGTDRHGCRVATDTTGSLGADKAVAGKRK